MRNTATVLFNFNNIQLWLLGIATGLITIHLTLTSRANDPSLLGTSTLFWISVCSIIWQKRDALNLESRVFSNFWGLLIIAFVLLKSISVSGYDPFLRLFPLISTFGVALLASGFKGLKQYWQELLILCFLVPSPGTLALLIDISTLTAKFANTILWYMGFEVYRKGVYIYLSNGGIEVYPGCSGIENMLHLLGLTVIFLFMFPTKLIEKLILPLVAVLIAFLVNGVRVAILAIFAGSGNPQALEYWHKGDGSLIFSMIGVGMLGLFCLFLLRQGEYEEHDSVEL
jgi:cyanoexosortase A